MNESWHGKKRTKGCTKESEGRGGCDDGDKRMMYYDVFSKFLASVCCILSTIGRNKWASFHLCKSDVSSFRHYHHHQSPSSLPSSSPSFVVTITKHNISEHTPAKKVDNGMGSNVMSFDCNCTHLSAGLIFPSLAQKSHPSIHNCLWRQKTERCKSKKKQHF